MVIRANFQDSQPGCHEVAFICIQGQESQEESFRKLWITRINAAARMNGMSYSRFMNCLRKSGINLNRKMLADMAVNDEKAFAQLVESIRMPDPTIHMQYTAQGRNGPLLFCGEKMIRITSSKNPLVKRYVLSGTRAAGSKRPLFHRRRKVRGRSPGGIRGSRRNRRTSRRCCTGRA